jgi:hypothetical protein
MLLDKQGISQLPKIAIFKHKNEPIEKSHPVGVAFLWIERQIISSQL